MNAEDAGQLEPDDYQTSDGRLPFLLHVLVALFVMFHVDTNIFALARFASRR